MTGLDEEQIAEILKKNPLIREYAKKEDEDKICKCGHKEKYHHNHSTFQWTEGHCNRCMKCEWNGKNQCYSFFEKYEEDLKKGNFIFRNSGETDEEFRKRLLEKSKETK